MTKEVVIEITKDQETNSWVAKCNNPYVVSQSKEFNDIFKSFGHVFYGNVMLNKLEDNMPEKVKVIIDNQTKEMNWSQFIPDWYYYTY